MQHLDLDDFGCMGQPVFVWAPSIIAIILLDIDEEGMNAGLSLRKLSQDTHFKHQIHIQINDRCMAILNSLARYFNESKR